jgi:hypothetical protein
MEEREMAERTGRCLCGAVTFTLFAISGSLSEHVKTAHSGNRVTLEFCSSCGSHLFAKVSARPQFRVVRAGNLDEPSSVQPNMNIWVERAPSWACLDPALERVKQQPLPPTPAPTSGTA